MTPARATAAALVAAALAGASGAGQTRPPDAAVPAPALTAPLAASLDPVIEALWDAFDRPAAMAHVTFMSRYWRLAGNPGYDRSIEHLRQRLIAAGFDGAGRVGLEVYPGSGRSWDHSAATLAILEPGGGEDVVLSHERERLALAINSFSTPAGGLVAPLVDVGRGDREEDYAGRSVRGAVVLGDADLNALWRRAVAGQGAAGVVSTALARYISPDPPGAPPAPRGEWDILQWGSVPYDEARAAFGFKASPRAAARLRRALAAAGGAVRVRVHIAATFTDAPTRTLVAEIPGRAAPDERVILAAHVQEPGANDNASGAATLVELAAALAAAVREGRIAPPGRTLTFLWLDEIRGSQQWLRDHAKDAAGVRYMFSLDMTGQDTAKTGGTFLIERTPDPAAVWDRPWDPHSEWGRGTVDPNSLRGDLLNDLHHAVCLRVAERSGWVVRTNPYEGGSDHTVFGNAGVPAVLDWHFTDRYYHTNFDTPDKTSPDEMRNVGVAVAASAWLLASAGEREALEVARLVAQAGRARVALEDREGARLAAAAPDRETAFARERVIQRAWRAWYAEAVLSAGRLVVGPASPQFAARLRELAAVFLGAVTPPAPAGFRLIPAAWAPAAQEAPSREALLLALDRLAADKWRLATARSEPAADLDRLGLALASPRADLRRLAIRGVGRLELAEMVNLIQPFLEDADEGVRRETAAALAQALRGVKGAGVLAAAAAIEARIGAGERAAVWFESLGRLAYDRDAAMAIEGRLRALVERGAIDAGDLLRWLEPVVRRDRAYPFGAATRRDLVARARPAAPGARSGLFALEALGPSLAEAERPLVSFAAAWRCPGADPECGWDVRFAAVQMVPGDQPWLDEVFEAARRDAAFQVRVAALRRIAAGVARTGRCDALVEAFDDPVPIVRLEAVRLVDPRCAGREAIAARLAALAAGLEAGAGWHVPARALETLARFDPPAAARMAAGAAAGHAAWQVRAAAARVSVEIKDAALAARLARDAHPNVRTAALDALVRLDSPEVVAAAVAALDSPDYQLVRAAAQALRGRPAGARTVGALADALARLTRDGADTSRDPRVAILDRLREFARPDDAGRSPLLSVLDRLRPLLADFDPRVAGAAADAIGAATGARPDPAPGARASEQPTEAELASLPRRATIVVEGGGRMELDLLVDEAPMAVARFARLARAGYYDGLTFHRVVPLFVIQGGSPGANEYVGAARYLRDEIGFERHTRGAVGLSTRGRDTGDAQIFIDLVDIPRLNHDYTVFARIPLAPDGTAGAAGMAVADAILEGARIVRVEIR